MGKFGSGYKFGKPANVGYKYGCSCFSHNEKVYQKGNKVCVPALFYLRALVRVPAKAFIHYSSFSGSSLF